MICIPIVGPSMSKAQEQIESALVIADILELRLDLIVSPAYELNSLLDLGTRCRSLSPIVPSMMVGNIKGWMRTVCSRFVML